MHARRLIASLAVAFGLLLAAIPGWAAESGGCTVLLLPADDFNERYAAFLAGRLGAITGLRVKPTTVLGTAGLAPFPDGAGGEPQYATEAVAALAMPVVDRLRRSYGDGMAIVLTTKDVNSQDRTFRYLFAQHDWENRLTVISVRRMMLSTATRQATRMQIEQRLMKFMLRSVGEHIYRLQRTTDIGSVMYSPIMSLDDLDAMGMRLDGHGDPCKSQPIS